MPTKTERGQALLTEGLIIREYNGVGEADRFITVLTKEYGVVRAVARGARRIKSRAGGATALLMYSRLRLIAGRDNYIVEDAQPIETFFGLREEIGRTALAQYFCELAAALCPADEPAPDALRVLLYALHHLANNTRPQKLLKAVVEWRLLSEAGYMPDLSACAACGKEAEGMYLSLVDGQLFCPDHRPPVSAPLSAGAIAAVRHAVNASAEKCCAFSLPEPSLSYFADAAEAFLKAQLNRGFKTLDFYHTIEVT